MTDVKDLYKYPGDVDAFGFDWGQLSVTLGPQVNGAQQFSGGRGRRAAGTGPCAPQPPGQRGDHLHPRGRGRADGGGRGRKPAHAKTVRAGCSVFIPESRFHSTLNTGSSDMKIFVVYSPAGPEELLKEMPDFRLIPAGG